MPTPIQHLVIADVVLDDTALPPAAREFLVAQRGAFLFGTIAADAQSVSGQTREATHFFTMPPSGNRPAHQVMFEAHPALARAGELGPEQAAFIAGYISHLALDELWIATVFGPCFGLEAKWGAFPERLLTHNVLRTWLDQRDGARLRRDVSDSLSQVEPRGWLPFIADDHLRAWRDEIARQARPGALVHTAEVFAARLHVPPAEFHHLLDSPEEMQRRVFSHVSSDRVDKFYADAQTVSARLIVEYLSPGRPSRAGGG